MLDYLKKFIIIIQEESKLPLSSHLVRVSYVSSDDGDKEELFVKLKGGKKYDKQSVKLPKFGRNKKK